ncbi:3-hydroxy-3-methylglutaryl-coenzyme A reductase [Vairimorpha necatrix]|uniref:hydroxymethylglutaryl-CoA reductase (NADPH) n=1 Tax=Vairimorpha necatrix TaxID=6039 RepID=A0AAX4JBA7_9MICR
MNSENSKINDLVKKRSEEIRREMSTSKNINLKGIIYDDDFTEIYNRCCENILGYRKVPIGMSHTPIKINNQEFYIPICTFEGALVASMCRGIKLINKSQGITGHVENIGITRSFAIEFKNFTSALNFYKWLKNEKNLEILKKAGEKNSRFCKIKSIESKNVFGSVVFIKICAYTGDAMGMNMITKAANQIIDAIHDLFNEVKLITLSANICTDKKWSTENYANGRGRKVFLNLRINESDLLSIMKVSINDLLNMYHTKIVLGGSIILGGFNCQASNYVAATFLAFNQDLGHVIESSNCIIDMKKISEEVLEINLLMPSIVVGTIGGGTHLEPANSLFKQFEGLPNFNTDERDLSGSSNYLALVVASAVLAGEISGMCALTNNTLMDAHLRLNRKQ